MTIDHDRAEKLLKAAQNDEARCGAHGHEVHDDAPNDPVVVEKVDGKLELWCFSCAEHYGQDMARTGFGALTNNHQDPEGSE